MSAPHLWGRRLEATTNVYRLPALPAARATVAIAITVAFEQERVARRLARDAYVRRVFGTIGALAFGIAVADASPLDLQIVVERRFRSRTWRSRRVAGRGRWCVRRRTTSHRLRRSPRTGYGSNRAASRLSAAARYAGRRPSSTTSCNRRLRSQKLQGKPNSAVESACLSPRAVLENPHEATSMPDDRRAGAALVGPENREVLREQRVRRGTRSRLHGDALQPTSAASSTTPQTRSRPSLAGVNASAFWTSA